MFITHKWLGRHSIPGISMALIMAVLLVSTTVYAGPRHHGEHHPNNPPGPVSCEDLAGIIDGDPGVKSVSSDPATYTPQPPPFGPGGPSVEICQVDILYGMNPDQNINIRIGLPLNSLDGGTGGVEGAWNGRTQATGGGGCAGSLDVYPVTAGYVGSGTDTGHGGGDCTPGVNEDGTYNDQFINDFIRNGIKAQVLFMKSVAESYYGMKPAYNYWNGCSTGGRQGYLLAQELPNELDGILANAPAIYWTRFQTAQMWGQVVMNNLVGGPIDPAKLDLATAAAITACDADDGVTDGVIDDPRTCNYSATDLITETCTTIVDPSDPFDPDRFCLTPEEALAIDMIWDGPRNADGNKIWYGLDRGTPLCGSFFGMLFGLNCPFPFDLGVTQLQWDEHDRNFDWTTMSIDDYAQVAQDGSRNIADVTDTLGDLDMFRLSGGKMITMVGASDQLIMPRGVINYYRQMAMRYDKRRHHRTGGQGHGKDIDFSSVQEFYRLFRAPGVGHCSGGNGPQPLGLFEALVAWVEDGIAPDQILAATFPPAPTRTRPLCPYPETAIYDGIGNPDLPTSFSCGGNLETTSTVCEDILVKYKHEVNGPLDFRGTGVNRFECYDVE